MARSDDRVMVEVRPFVFVNEAALGQKRKTKKEPRVDPWLAAARANFEAHIGDVVAEYDNITSDELAEETYTLAFDGAVDAGAPTDKAQKIARKVVRENG
jgi:hypothetical protein